MKNKQLAVYSLLCLSIILNGCARPNSSHFEMTPEQVRETKKVSQETREADRKARNQDNEDAAKLRVWEAKNTPREADEVKKIIVEYR